MGITILYCLWATPPKFRTNSYNSKNVLEAVRACSNNLAIIAERWESAKDLLDIFELLATEVPLVESASSHVCGRATRHISDDAVDEIRSKLSHVKSMILNREIIRMIEEMITEDFPGDQDTAMESFSNIADKIDLPTASGPMTTQIFPTVNLPLYQYPSPYLSADHSVSQISPLSPGQTLEFPGSLSGYDMF